MKRVPEPVAVPRLRMAGAQLREIERMVSC
jgi:hypothetical protein